MPVKILVAVIFYFLYWGICFAATGSDKKNLAGLRSYPDEVQSIVREKMSLGGEKPKQKSAAVILFANLVMFSVVFSLLGLVLKNVFCFESYLSAFWYFLALGEGLGAFDLLVIDLLWWRNSRRIRFSFLPQKQYYQNPKKHIGSFVRGIPLFAAVAAVAALTALKLRRSG